MLNIPRDTLAWIIAKAREVEVKDVDTSDGESDGDDPLGVLEDRGDDASAQELRSWIEDLDDEGRAELVALFWLGRGDGGPEDFPQLKRQALASATRSTADYLLGEPLMADLLEEGLEALGISVSEVEDEI